MDDDCDFDTLSAMLDADGDDMTEKPTRAKSKEEDTPQDSSDDDIDEDELDKLAALVENEDLEEGTATLPARNPLKEAKGVSAISSKVKENSATPIKGSGMLSSPAKLKVSATPNKDKEAPSAAKPEEGSSARISASPSPRKSEEQSTPRESVCHWPQGKAQVSLSPEEQQTKLDELQLMKERIRLLEAQLSQQPGVPALPAESFNTPIKTEPVEKIHSHKSTSHHASPRVGPNNQSLSSSSKTSSQAERGAQKNGGSRSKVSLLEEDIFGSPLDDLTDAPSSSSQSKSLRATEPKEPEKDKAKPKETQKVKSFYGGKRAEVRADDSGSDWDDMDGEKPDNLSKEGRQIKKLINDGPRSRVAHDANFDKSDLEVYRKTHTQKSWKDKPAAQASQSGTHVAKTKPENEPKVSKEYFSGIRIVNPLVSGSRMRTLMEGRRMIRVSRLHAKAKSVDVEGDWVTIAVVVNKGQPKMSSKGNNYSVWKLNDLEDCERTVSLFLFGEVHKQHWKMLTGTVIGLLNPSIMKNLDTDAKKNGSDDLSITVDNPLKLMKLGRSKDYGICKATTKAGKNCNNFINQDKGEYCTYHVQNAYKKVSAKRAELQAGHTGVVPRSFERKLFNKGNTVMYQGQTYTSIAQNAKPKSTVSLKGLQTHTLHQPGLKNKITTLALHDLIPDDKEKLEKLKRDKHEAFHGLLTVPTVGSLNFVKHLKHKEFDPEKDPGDEKEAPKVQSVSISQFMKQARQEMAAKRQQHQAGRGEPGVCPSPSATATPSPGPSPARGGLPRLGRGFGPGMDIDLSVAAAPSAPAERRSKQSKQKAIAKIRAGGGIKKESPNAVKKPRSPEHQERVQKRVAAAMEEGDENDEGNRSSADKSQPPKKKSRMIGNLDMDSPEVQKLLKARSKHDGALTEMEQEKQDLYFDTLEKKEQMEDKMRSTTEVKCKAVTCRQCNYTALSAAQRCRDERHKLTTHDAVKRFFKCKDCSHRTVSLHVIPVMACKNCGGSSYERTSMLKEKAGPKLASEQLLLRGEEIKNLNSLN